MSSIKALNQTRAPPAVSWVSAQNVLVGLYMERSLEMIVALLAILKAGGGYVPLDPAYPKDRIRFVLDDARVQVLLTQSSLMRSSS